MCATPSSWCFTCCVHPKLPELPRITENERPEIHKFPSYPNDSFGKKFSQSAIKDAVIGKKEDEDIFEDESFDENIIPEPKKRLAKEFPFSKEEDLPQIKTKEPKEFFVKPRIKEAEPIFIRLDKFEESLEIFKNAKNKISEIEKFLDDIKRIKEQEERELQEWEKEIQEVKEQFEKIDKEIFSKV